jgi:hypothetical protein
MVSHRHVGLRPLPGPGWLAALAALVVGAVSASEVTAAEDYAAQASRLAVSINQASTRLFALRSAAGTAAYKDAETHYRFLLGKKLELDRLAADLGNRQSRIEGLKGKMSQAKLDWESAEQTYRQHLEQLQSRQAALKAEVEAHNRENQALGAEGAAHNRDAAAQRRAVAEYTADLGPFRRDLAAYNGDVAAYNQAVAAYNALPAQQRTQAEYNRLQQWKGSLVSRKAVLDGRRSALQSRWSANERWRVTVDSRKARLDARAADINARAIRLSGRIKDVVAIDGKKLLELRVQASEKQRNLSAAASALQKLEAEQHKRAADFQVALSQAHSSAGKLTAALARAAAADRPAAKSFVALNNSQVRLTPRIEKTLAALEPYFQKANINVRVTSGYRSPQHQLELIREQAIAYGLDKKYPSIRTATVADIESWRGAWDELLNVKGYIINPPVPAKCLLGERRGKVVPASPHILGKSFDLATGDRADLGRVAALVEAFRRDAGLKMQIRIEHENNAVHVGLQ